MEEEERPTGIDFIEGAQGRNLVAAFGYSPLSPDFLLTGIEHVEGEPEPTVAIMIAADGSPEYEEAELGKVVFLQMWQIHIILRELQEKAADLIEENDGHVPPRAGSSLEKS